MTKAEIISNYWQGACDATKNTGIFPQTLISQLILESGYNLSSLSTLYYNFFGIKADSYWSGQVVSKTTKEYVGGYEQTFYGTGLLYSSRNAALNAGADSVTLFRVYPSVMAGFSDYINFLNSNSRYRKAGVFDASTPEEQFDALQAAGYATEQDYASQLKDVYNSLLNYFPPIVYAAGGSLILILLLGYFLIRKRKTA